MTEVKALFPIGKTQWSKWRDKQKIAFNEAREAGVPFADAVEAANAMKSGGLLGVLKDVADVAETVADVAVALNPVVGVATTVVRATRATRKKKV
jgi:hypothetical protein